MHWLSDLPLWLKACGAVIGALGALFGAHRIYLTWDE